MPSSAGRSLFDSRVMRSLSSVRLGIVLGFAASALLAISSLTIPDPRGENALPFSESFLPFFQSFQLRYAWFWALAAVLVLFGLNLLLATLRTSLRPRRAWNLRIAGVVLMHVGVLAGLVTHVAAGLSARIETGALLTHAPTPIAGHTLRLVHMSVETNPDGSLRTASATVAVDGKRRTLAYNDPLFFDGMRRFVLVEDVRLVRGRESMRAERALVVMVRRNDGIPVLLVASVIFCLGLLLFLVGRRRSGT